MSVLYVVGGDLPWRGRAGVQRKTAIEPLAAGPDEVEQAGLSYSVSLDEVNRVQALLYNISQRYRGTASRELRRSLAVLLSLSSVHQPATSSSPFPPKTARGSQEQAAAAAPAVYCPLCRRRLSNPLR